MPGKQQVLRPVLFITRDMLEHLLSLLDAAADDREELCQWKECSCQFGSDKFRCHQKYHDIQERCQELLAGNTKPVTLPEHLRELEAQRPQALMAALYRQIWDYAVTIFCPPELQERMYLEIARILGEHFE